MGMAFVDVLLSEPTPRITLVDRRGQPGGHWNDAYPFVRLHQPSMFYGVKSTPLGGDRRDVAGGNEGLFELATKGEILAYFSQVLHRRFLPSGRVRYFPQHELEERHRGPLVAQRRRSGSAGEKDRRCHLYERHRPEDASACVRGGGGHDGPFLRTSCRRFGGPPERFRRDWGGQDPESTVAFGCSSKASGPSESPGSCLEIPGYARSSADPADRPLLRPERWVGFARELEEIVQASSIEDLFLRLESAGRLLRFRSVDGGPPCTDVPP